MHGATQDRSGRVRLFCDDALDLYLNHGISPADCWYLACARHYDAEFWISHPQRDGLLENARRVHTDTFALTERRFPSVVGAGD